MRGWFTRYAALAIYPVLALVAYPLAEYLIAGTRASVYGLDVFDDGSVARLGALAPVWREHGLTLWNPLLTAGNTWFSQFALPPVAPDTLLTLLLTPFEAFFTVQLALPLVAGVGLHVFARRSLRLPHAAAVVGGTVYALSLWHYPIGLAGPAIPLLLTVLNGFRRHVALATAVHAGLLIMVMHQGLLQVAMLAALLQIGWIRVGVSGRRRKRALAIWLGGWVLAGVVSAPMLVSLAVALPDSHRLVWDVAPNLAPHEAATELGRRYASIVLAAPLPGGWGLHPPYQGTWFAGAIAFPLAAVGAWRALHGPSQLRFVAVLIVAIPLLDLVGLLAGPLLEDAGPLGSFQLERVRHFVPFVLAACAAIGMAGVRSGRIGSRVALIAGLAVLAVQAPSVLERIGEISSLGRVVAPDWLRITWLMATVAGAALLVAMGWLRSRGALAAVVLIGLVTTLAVERATYVRVERGLVPNGTTSWEERLGDSPIIARVQAETAVDHSRVLMTGLYPNTLLYHRVRSVTGYENVYPLSVHQLLDVMFAPYLDANADDADYYRTWGNRAVAFEPVWARQIVDLLAARWIVSDGSIRQSNIAPIMQDGSLTLYRNDAALPRAFVVGATEAFVDRQRLLAALAEADTADLATSAYVSATDAVPDTGATGTARFVVDHPDRIELEVDASADGLLIVADTFMPGWQATVDGAPAPVLRAYAALRGVPVPSGPSTVVLEYRPSHMPIAFGASLLGIGLLAALAFFGVRRG